MSTSAATPPPPVDSLARTGRAGDLASVWLEYWTQVLPAAAAELTRWERRALQIPDRQRRRQALGSLGAKRWNALGVTMFATGRGRYRTAALRYILTLQLIYDHVDTISEASAGGPARDTSALHSALIDAVTPESAGGAFDALHADAVDGGYLGALVAEAQRQLAALPAHPAATPALVRQASEIAAVQRHKHGPHEERQRALRAWAAARGNDWVESGAAGCSPLTLHACAALGACPASTRADVRRTEEALRPGAALDALLDSYVDEADDRRTGELNWLTLYRAPGLREARLLDLIDRALDAVRALPERSLHECVLHSMIGYYLSDPAASVPARTHRSARLLRHAGPLSEVAAQMLSLRRDPVRMAHAAVAATPRLRQLGTQPC